MTSETAKTTFVYQLRQYGIDRLVKSPDFIASIFSFLVIFIDSALGLKLFAPPDDNSVIAIFAAASTLFAITLAALAIILSFSSSEFVRFLRTHDKFFSILFLFWIGNAAYLTTVLLSALYLILNSQTFDLPKRLLLYPLTVATFVYALIETYYILAAVIRFGHFLDLFERQGK